MNSDLLICHKKYENPRAKHQEVSTNGQSGGANRDRTDDLLHAMQALSHLSYNPIPTESRKY